jgi:hypothetical protein
LEGENKENLMRRLFNIPPQIVRLVLLTIAIVTVYLAARHVLTPPTFGQYGWYRGDVLAEIAAREPVHAGRQSCLECHLEQHQQLAGAGHKDLSCESCHGVGREHADNPDMPLPKITFDHCVRCHEEDPARPKWLPQVNPRTHFPEDSCTECHVPHAPSEML